MLFRSLRHDIQFRAISGSATDQYEDFEPRLNNGAVELLDDPTTVEELLTLVVKGAKVTHESNSHDDHANAVALAVNAVLQSQQIPPAFAVAAGTPWTERGMDFGDNRRGLGCFDF